MEVDSDEYRGGVSDWDSKIRFKFESRSSELLDAQVRVLLRLFVRNPIIRTMYIEA